MRRHVEEFFRLDCAGDVLNSAQPKKLSEIIRAVAIMKRMRPTMVRYDEDGLVKDPQFNLECFCDDNGFLASFLAHVFKFESVTMHPCGKHDGLNTKGLAKVKNLDVSVHNPDLDENSILIGVGMANYKELMDAYEDSECIRALFVPNILSMTGYTSNDDLDRILFDNDHFAKVVYLREMMGGFAYWDHELPGGNNWIVSNLG